MNYTLKIATLAAGVFLAGPASAAPINGTASLDFGVKHVAAKTLLLLKHAPDGAKFSQRSSKKGGRRPRVPGGSGCDDPHDLIEHPECNVGGSTVPARAGRAVVVFVEIAPNGDVEIHFANGWKEELTAGGMYEVKNANNRTVTERVATAVDVARIKALAGY
jgi:hypothetical protein